MRYLIQILSVFMFFGFAIGGPQIEVTVDNYKNDIEVLIDSLKVSKNNSTKENLLDSIRNKIDNLENDSALYYWNYIIEDCNKTNYYYGAAFSNYNAAKLYNTKGEYFKSYQAYHKSKQNYEKIDYLPGLARVHNGLGIVFKNLSKFDLSQSNYKESARLFKELNDTIHEGWIYLNIGGMLEKQDSLEQAKKYLAKSKGILESINDKDLISCYINIGEVYKKEAKYDSAYYYYLKGYDLSNQNGDSYDKFQSSYHLGGFLFEQNQVSKAEPYLTEAYNIAQIQNNLSVIPVDDLALFANVLSKLYIIKGDSAKAYKFLLQSTNYEIENKREQSNAKLSKIEFEVFEREAYILKKRRGLIIIFTMAGLLISILLVLALYRSYKNKQKANRLLTEMDVLKTRLYSNITHELRTPLTLILGPLEQILSSETRKKFTHKQVKMMRKNAKSLLNMINQMLDLSKIEAKSITLELVEKDINKFIRIRFAAFASLASQKSISYKYSLLKEKNIRIFDASKLEKIINNLISNAIKFTPQKGEISCFVNFPKQNILELIIKDSGKGIPENELDIIFDRYHQVENSETTNTIGTGIGLSLAKELIELMHGKINVESELGKGSKFAITLKLGTKHLNNEEFNLIQSYNSDTQETFEIEENIEDSGDCPNYQDSKNSNNLPHVLVTEDHADIREFIAENLKECFNVDDAENGRIGLEKATKNIPDLVITDVVMPEMDGIEFCRNLKTDERTSHIPVIMLTGKSSIDDKIRGLETGADAYLNKPFNIKELNLRVRKLIEQRQKLRERFTNNINLEPKDIAVTSADEKFIMRVMEIIEKNIGNSEFEITQFQQEMLMSRMQLFRKIKALTNQTPSEFVRTIRLKRAASLMHQNFGNIAQITFEVGFNNPSYFAKCFKELFGKLPSEYIKNHD